MADIAYLRVLKHLLLVIATMVPVFNAVADPAKTLDDFERTEGWSSVAASGGQVFMTRGRSARGSALRIDFDFRQGGGEVIVHKAFPVILPANFALRFSLRGNAPRNLLEVRLVDASGKNVWRFRDPEFRVSNVWQTVRVKQRRFEFGWGPAAGGVPKELGLIEFVVERGEGGRGTLWLDDLRLEPLPPDRPYSGTPVLTASSAQAVHGPEHLLKDAAGPAWHSAGNHGPEWLVVDFRASREFGGLIIDWEPDDYATDYRVERSDDGRHWQRAYTASRGNGGRDYIPLPESESRYLRLRLDRSSRGAGFGIRRIEVVPLEFSASPNRMFEHIARDSPRGLYPRYFLGEQTYWTIVGSPGTELAGADREALLSEDGAIEADEGVFTVEPFLYTGGRLRSWADGTAMPSLERGYLPIPSVRLEHGDLSLSVTALADHRSRDSVYARYRVENHGSETVTGSLFLMVRPFLVNPPWQALHTAGGASRIHSLLYRQNALWADGHPSVMALTSPADVGVAGFDGYPITAEASRNTVPSAQAVTDERGWATGTLRYPFAVAPGASAEVFLALPSRQDPRYSRLLLQGAEAGPFWADRFAETVKSWETSLDRVEFLVPAPDADLVRAVKSNLAYILIHRDGPMLRPGSRRYGRTWIRDAAITSAALLAFGHSGEVREFLRWYAGYQAVDGAVPCCLDPWGPDPMIEHDSGGEFLSTLASYYRYSGDLTFLKALWPQAIRTADYLAGLRRQRLVPAYTHGDAERFFGLLPESASHEGYIAHPVHSYWDDFWALRGIGDAARLAHSLGDHRRAAQYSELGEAFRNDVERSISLSRNRFGIDYVPGSADLGDLDPTSTAIALSLGGEISASLLPSLRRTFERYFTDLKARIDGEPNWQSYAPYEFRNVSALVRLGEREKAFQALRYLFEGRRPPGWNQWPEVVWRNPATGNFIGDLPHTWVGAEFIQAFLSLFAYEEPSGRLVLGAGLPRAWVDAPGGTGISGLRTPFGRLNYRVEASGPGETRMRIDGGLTLPPEGIVIDLPVPRGLSRIEVNGRPVASADTRLELRELPATVLFRQ